MLGSWLATRCYVRDGSHDHDRPRRKRVHGLFRGFDRLSENDFVNHFAAEVDLIWARMKYALGASVSAFEEVMDVAAWKSMSFWYLVAQNDEAITPRTPTGSSRSGWERMTNRDSVEPRS